MPLQSYETGEVHHCPKIQVYLQVQYIIVSQLLKDIPLFDSIFYP